MENSSLKTRGIVMSVVGVILVLLNALDYLLRWNVFSSAIGAIGIVFAAGGAAMVRRSRNASSAN